MAHLIDGVVYEAQELGIETRTPDELATKEQIERFNEKTVRTLYNNMRATRNIGKTLEAVFGSIIPLLFIVAGIIAFKALEAQLVTLSATLGYIGISYAVGFVFNVLYSREIHAKNGGDSNGK